MRLAQPHANQFQAEGNARTVGLHIMHPYYPHLLGGGGFQGRQPPWAGQEFSFKVPKTKKLFSSSPCLAFMKPWIWSLGARKRMKFKPKDQVVTVALH